MNLKFLKWTKGRGAQTFQLNDDDIAVFVVGPSGSGKSSFVEEATKSGLVAVGKNLHPCTANVQAIRCELTEEGKKDLGSVEQKNIVFIDTPSFHTGRYEDKPEQKMHSWLSKSRCSSTLVGIIYMHKIETDPRYEPVQQHLDTFALSFPQDFIRPPQRLRAVFSSEGKVREDKVRVHMETFQAQLGLLGPSLKGKLPWSTSTHPDLFTHGDSATAWQAVVALFSDTMGARLE